MAMAGAGYSLSPATQINSIQADLVKLEDVVNRVCQRLLPS